MRAVTTDDRRTPVGTHDLRRQDADKFSVSLVGFVSETCSHDSDLQTGRLCVLQHQIFKFENDKAFMCYGVLVTGTTLDS